MTFAEFVSVANVATPIAVGIVGVLWRNSVGRLEKDYGALATRVNELEETRVEKETFIREGSRTRDTLEKLVEGQARIEGRLDMLRIPHGEDERG